MLARPFRPLLSIVAFTLLAATSVSATSRSFPVPGKVAKKTAPTAPTCRIAARFVEAKPKRGKVVWIFERIGDLPPASPCAVAGSPFEVWIWQGSYSALNRSLVYPIYVEEPKAGAEVELELARQDIREQPSGERYLGWFLAAGEGAVRVRAP